MLLGADDAFNPYMQDRFALAVPQHVTTRSCCLPAAVKGKHWCTGQDLDVWNKFIRPRGSNGQGGVVVEMGVPSGCFGSHSKAFEHRLGWSSILIEASPLAVRLLRKERPNATIVPAAVCTSHRNVTFVQTSSPGLNYIEEFGFLNRSISRTATLKQWKARKVARHVVRCEPLSAILAGHKKIDVMFLDCEGCEEEAIRSMDPQLRHHAVGVLNIEGGSPQSSIGPLLSAHGYKYGGQLRAKADHVWVRPDWFRSGEGKDERVGRKHSRDTGGTRKWTNRGESERAV